MGKGSVVKDEKNWMIIRVTDLDLVQAFLSKCEKAGLSISNDDETDNGIEHLEIGNSISLGTSNKFQVNWARNIDYYAKRGIVPVYDISLDWSKIVARLNDYIANQKKGVELSGGDIYEVNRDNCVIFNDDTNLEFNEGQIDLLKKIVSMGYDISFNEESGELVIDNGDSSLVITADELDAIKFN